MCQALDYHRLEIPSSHKDVLSSLLRPPCADTSGSEIRNTKPVNSRNSPARGRNRPALGGWQKLRTWSCGSMGGWGRGAPGGQGSGEKRAARKAHADSPTATQEQGEKLSCRRCFHRDLQTCHPGSYPACLFRWRPMETIAPQPSGLRGTIRPGKTGNSTFQLLIEPLLWARHSGK